MSRKVLIYPSPENIEKNNGIGRVVHAQYKHLPNYDIDLVGTEAEAEVVFLHTQMYDYKRVDVLGVHGLYWTGDYGSGKYDTWHIRANDKIADAARKAKKIVVPADWVAEPFRRDMLIQPVIIPHGIDTAEWTPLTMSEYTQSPKYLLWGKNRAGDVCDPKWAHQLALMDIPVISTFAPAGPTIPDNMKVIGKQPEGQMKALIRHATALLVTTKETFGIQTLEALASGVPVLCFDFGGQKDIIQHKVNGYKVAPYDVDGLKLGWEYILAHWKEMSEAARERAKQYSWEQAAKQYAELFQSDFSVKPNTVSIVIPCYNYGKYVGAAIESALAQTKPAEVIVVDDGSTDNSLEVMKQYADKVTIVEQKNAGVASARNIGVSYASGNLIVCLDADDRLDPRYIETLEPAFTYDAGLGIAYSGLGLVQADGTIRPNPWPPEFSWAAMTAPTNPPASCIHSAAMFRKELWKRAGGYTQSMAPAEDTYLWLTGLSRGFTAERIVEDSLFFYRAHEGSASRTKPYRSFEWIHWLKTGKYPFAAPAEKMPEVRSYSEPLVSVIIPVSEAHREHVRTAIRSVFWQSFQDWELQIIVDGFDAPELKTEFPYIKYTKIDEVSGPAVARNAGITSTSAPFVLFLDADDWLAPDALADMFKAYKGKYIYTDWVLVEGDKQTVRESGNYDPDTARHMLLHPVTVLMPTDQASKLGFDESLPALEDFDFYSRAAVAGYHGERLSKPLVIVNVQEGQRTKNLKEKRESLIKTIQDRYKDAPMASCCGGNVAALAALQRYNDNLNVAPSEPVGEGLVRMEYIGPEKGATSWGGVKIVPSNRIYRGGNNPFERYVDADPRDVTWLEGTGKWKRISFSTLS